MDNRTREALLTARAAARMIDKKECDRALWSLPYDEDRQGFYRRELLRRARDLSEAEKQLSNVLELDDE